MELAAWTKDVKISVRLKINSHFASTFVLNPRFRVLWSACFCLWRLCHACGYWGRRAFFTRNRGRSVKSITALSVAGILSVALIGSSAPSEAAVMDVDLELSLVVDVSGSVSTSEFNLQRQGYVDAFNSTVIQDAILGGPLQRIAVNLIYFGSNATEAIEFSLIDSVASAQSFATAIAAAPRSEAGSTGIGNGINLAASTLADNDFNGTRSVIDVSGDGTNNTGAPVTAARDDACGGGVDAINAIAIGSTSLETYYDSNVVCGANGFSLFAADFAGFSSAIATKLEAEIRNEDPGVVPLPVPAALLLTGLGGLGLIRRRK